MSSDLTSQATAKEKVFLMSTMAAALVGLVVYSAGNKGPHDFSYEGRVVDSKELYGDVVRGYATPRKGLLGKIEAKVHDVLRPGEPMHLLQLSADAVDYDTMSWFNTEHHHEAVSGVEAFVAVDGNPARLEDRFTSSAGKKDFIGHVDPVLSARGVRYEGRVLREVRRDLGMRFYRRE